MHPFTESIRLLRASGLDRTALGSRLHTTSPRHGGACPWRFALRPDRVADAIGRSRSDRWDELGWIETQALRIVQLGELVHFAPWDEGLRADWRARWEHVKEIGEATRDLAYMLTPQVIALTAWNDVMASAEEDYLPKVRPIPVMWTSTVNTIVRRVTGNETEPMREAGERSQVKTTAYFPYEQLSALRFRRALECPARDAPEATLDAALLLANSAEFQDARRALYTAEALAASGQMPPEEFGREIDAAVTRYNQVVAAYAGATRRRIIHHVLPFAVGEALPLTHVPGAGAAGSWLVHASWLACCRCRHRRSQALTRGPRSVWRGVRCRRYVLRAVIPNAVIMSGNPGHAAPLQTPASAFMRAPRVVPTGTRTGRSVHDLRLTVAIGWQRESRRYERILIKGRDDVMRADRGLVHLLGRRTLWASFIAGACDGPAARVLAARKHPGPSGHHGHRHAGLSSG